jgi:hypothetical protein
MPQDIADVDAFTDPMTAPAGTDPADSASILAALQKAANRTRYLLNRLELALGRLGGEDGSGAWIYTDEDGDPAPKAGTVVIPGTRFAMDNDWQVATGQPDTRITAGSANKYATLSLDFLPEGSVITEVEFMVTPGGASTMTVEIGTRTLNFGTASDGSFSAAESDSSSGSSPQVIPLTVSPTVTVNKSGGVVTSLRVRSAQLADILSGARISWEAPGPV